MPTSIVYSKKLGPTMKPVRVMSKKTADQLTELMTGVVTEGTGTLGAIAAGQVAGKTGTAELGAVVESEEGTEEVVEGEEEAEPQHRKDAWFSAFATAAKPKLAIGVLLIEAEAAGGEVAAPIASQVLAAGYE
jgi:penicillin-binding protein A